MATSRILVTAVALLLVACGTDGGTDGDAGGDATEAATQPAATSEQAQLRISGFAFDDLTVGPAADVHVINADDAAHTVTAEDESFDVRVAGGGETTFTAPQEPGEYPFVCTIHPSMEATLTVG